jgi:hypothetical protein
MSEFEKTDGFNGIEHLREVKYNFKFNILKILLKKNRFF